MQKQPAKINYFFKGGYVELINTIKASFGKLGDNISDAWSDVVDNFLDFWGTFWSSIGGIISFDVDWDDLLSSIGSVCKFSFALGKLICVLIITTGLCVAFSVLHVLILFPIMIFAYIAFLFLLGVDTVYCHIKRISNNCENCQEHFSLPTYICPSCGAHHTSLRPSKYGIWKRTCDCGEKLPTTFFNGREKLDAICPNCGHSVWGGGKNVDICIPIVGGASAGKTCFISSAISKIEEVSSGHGLEYEYLSSGYDDYENNIRNMQNGILPDKTNEMRLRYYRFYLTPPQTAVKNLISLCDIGGEVYSDSQSLGEQIGYRYASAFVMVIDPLSIEAYRDEVARTADPVKYGCSQESIDAVLNMLISTLENMYRISAKEMLGTNVAAVFTKGDIPGLEDKIGEKAVAEYRRLHSGVSLYEAQNKVCEQFLAEYNEVNFLNSLKSKFKHVQFFVSSSLGHNANGMPFVATGVEEPVLWLLDRMPGNINLKDLQKKY